MIFDGIINDIEIDTQPIYKKANTSIVSFFFLMIFGVTIPEPPPKPISKKRLLLLGHLGLGFLQDLVKKWSVGDLVLELGQFWLSF